MKKILYILLLLLTFTLTSCGGGKVNLTAEDLFTEFQKIASDVYLGEDVDIEAACSWLIIPEDKDDCIDIMNNFDTDYQSIEVTYDNFTETELTQTEKEALGLEQYDEVYEVECDIVSEIILGNGTEDNYEGTIKNIVVVINDIYYLTTRD